MLKIVFSTGIDISAEYISGVYMVSSMYRNLIETRSQNFTAIHRSSRKLRGGICRYKAFCRKESLHVEPFCGLDVIEYMLKCGFC